MCRIALLNKNPNYDGMINTIIDCDHLQDIKALPTHLSDQAIIKHVQKDSIYHIYPCDSESPVNGNAKQSTNIEQDILNDISDNQAKKIKNYEAIISEMYNKFQHHTRMLAKEETAMRKQFTKYMRRISEIQGKQETETEMLDRLDAIYDSFGRVDLNAWPSYQNAHSFANTQQASKKLQQATMRAPGRLSEIRNLWAADEVKLDHEKTSLGKSTEIPYRSAVDLSKLDDGTTSRAKLKEIRDRCTLDMSKLDVQISSSQSGSDDT